MLQNKNPGEDEEKIKEFYNTNTPITSDVLVPPSQFVDFSQVIIIFYTKRSMMFKFTVFYYHSI